MAFNVVISDRAEKEYRSLIGYIYYSFADPFAAERLYNDFMKGFKRIENHATSYPISDRPNLAKRNVRIIHVHRGKYVILFRVIGSTAYIDDIFHCSQDYENAARLS